MADELRIGLSELLYKAMIDHDAGFLKEGVRVLSQTLMEIEEHIGATPGFDGNLDAALGAIEAKFIVMPPVRLDLYFTPEDSEYEVSHMPNAKLRPIPSIWGHFAGSGRNPEDIHFVDDALRELLAI